MGSPLENECGQPLTRCCAEQDHLLALRTMKKLILILMVAHGSAMALAPIHGILDEGALDRKVDPCENIYQYSCGKWLKNFKLPGDKSRYWRQGSVLNDNVEENLNGILSKLPKVTELKATAKNEEKLAAFYQSCRAIEKSDPAGLAELKARLKALEEVKDPASLAKAEAQLSLIGANSLFGYFADQDLKNSARMIAFIDRGGMSLPDVDYYLKDDAKSKEIRQKYQGHIARSLVIMGESSEAANKAAEQILAFETDLAKNSLKLDERRDTEKLFHPMTYAGLTKETAPDFDWATYFKTLGIPAPKKINVMEPAFMSHLSAVLKEGKYDVLIAQMKFKLIRRSSYFLAGDLQQEEFNFWRAYLNGQKELPPRWKYCTQIVSENMNEALGQAYLASVPNAKEIRAKTQTMMKQIRQAFAEELKTLTWMDDKTRAEANKKLVKMGAKIGWPGKWRDYRAMKIETGAFFKNELAATEYETKRNLKKVGTPTDRTEWMMSVWEPNAYYTGGNNEMVLPLGETVPPVFDPTFNDAPNLASLGGSTIGHELIHGFDDSGKDMDADGNFVTWWTDKSKAAFESQSECYVKQTEEYDIIPGEKLRIRGKATLGENLADNGGVKLGLMVLKRLIKERGKPAPEFAGLNELQQYFVGYAQSWCMAITDQKLRDQLLTDYHPPAEFRVNQVIANQPEFAEAFSCKEGARMAPKVRCSLW